MKIKIVLLALILSGGFAFSQNTKIQGSVNGGKFETAYLLDILTGDTVYSSSIEYQTVKKKKKKTQVSNSFSFNIDLNKEELYVLSFSKKNYTLIDVKPKDNISINFNVNKPDSSTVVGSEATQLIFEVNKKMRTTNDYNVLSGYLDSIVLQNTDKLISIVYALNIDATKYYETYKTLINKMQDQYSGYEYYRFLKEEYENLRSAEIGFVAPEIKLPNTEGDSVALSDYRGKYVFVNFWSSTCKYCRLENPNLVSAFNKYKDKGFVVFAVSIDRSVNPWISAIQQDKIESLVNVLDFNANYARKYGIKGTPSSVLLDPDGKVIGKDLRGNELDKALEKIFDN